MTTKIDTVDDQMELLNRIHGYADSARGSLLRGNDEAVTMTIGFMKSMIRRLEEIRR